MIDLQQSDNLDMSGISGRGSAASDGATGGGHTTARSGLAGTDAPVATRASTQRSSDASAMSAASGGPIVVGGQEVGNRRASAEHSAAGGRRHKGASKRQSAGSDDVDMQAITTTRRRQGGEGSHLKMLAEGMGASLQLSMLEAAADPRTLAAIH